ncbi:MAG: hypothetical protein HYZ53_05925 [Planctomycetes bacterium]|nr:hypothetical protein [Planctomycetota bacterium]
MSTKKTDLWPDDIGAPSEQPLPLSILREQARILGKKTGGAVEAEVRSEAEPQVEIDFMISAGPRFKLPEFGRNLLHRFILKAPGLSDYRYLLFSVSHELKRPYPAELRHDAHVFKVGSDEELTSRLREIFAAQSTKQIVASLVAQSR